MEIFKIERQGNKPQVAVSEVKEASGVQEDTVQQSEESELAQAKQLTGEDTPDQKAAAATPGTSEEKETNFSLGEEKTGQMLVKVDGPLGQIFTDSLNKILAYENMTMVPLLAEEYEQLREDQTFNETTSINVQAYDAFELKPSDVVDITNEITKTDDQLHILAMESARGLSSATGIAETVCAGNKTKTYYRMKSAAERVCQLALAAGI